MGQEGRGRRSKGQGGSGVAREGALGITFWGVRGSFPVPGAATALFGGNTCCVEIRVGQRLFIVDAGTGIVPLGKSLCAAMPSRAVGAASSTARVRAMRACQ